MLNKKTLGITQRVYLCDSNYCHKHKYSPNKTTRIRKPIIYYLWNAGRQIKRVVRCYTGIKRNGGQTCRRASSCLKQCPSTYRREIKIPMKSIEKLTVVDTGNGEGAARVSNYVTSLIATAPEMNSTTI